MKELQNLSVAVSAGKDGLLDAEMLSDITGIRLVGLKAASAQFCGLIDEFQLEVIR